MERKVIALVGAYGSGKTEISLNMAKDLAKTGIRTVLSDIDIVNPYFRSSEKIEWLSKNGVEVITPVFANTNVDSPMLSPKVGGYFVFKDINYILDVGGDPVGATALGQYRHKFKENGGKLYFVVNVNRPFTKDAKSIIEMMNEIESKSSIEIEGIINNSNMSYETTADDLKKGEEILKEVTKITGKPVILTCGTKEVLKEYQKSFKGKTYTITRQMGLDF